MKTPDISETESEHALIPHIVKTTLGDAMRRGAKAIHIVKRAESGRVLLRFRDDEEPEEIINVPVFIRDQLIVRFQRMVGSDGTFSIPLRSEEHQFGVQYQFTLTETQDKKWPQLILELQSMTCQNAIIRTENINMVSRVTGWDTLAAMSFLAKAKPLFYERFVVAAKYAIAKYPQYPDRKVYWLYDPIEDAPELSAHIKTVSAEVRRHNRRHAAEVRRYNRVYAHKRTQQDYSMHAYDTDMWKQRILRERYNIEWFTRAQMNPHSKYNMDGQISVYMIEPYVEAK